MPTRIVGATTIEFPVLTVDSTRIAAILQNIGTGPVWVSDEPERAAAHAALKIEPMGSLTILLIAGLRPDKAWYVVSEAGTVYVMVYENFYSGSMPGNGSGGGGGNGGGGGGTPGSLDSRNAAAALFAAFGAGGAL